MLSIEGTKKTFVTYDGTRVDAIGGISLEIQAGKLLTLLGPSGCGKTTTLRSVAGLETPDEGRIVIAGETVFDSSTRTNIAANRRGIGMVFQSYAIWPHMSVFENVAFPLRVARDRKYSRNEIARMVTEALEMVHLGGYESRASTQLSGGQQQRLALARGLVRKPKLLLLDEPLSNLDAKLREQMRFELKRLQVELGITSLYVTHDQAEALALSDEIAVMNAGQVVQRGTPYDVYHRPRNEFVARFVGSANILTGQVERVIDTDGLGIVTTSLGAVRGSFTRLATVGEEVVIIIRPEDVMPSAREPDVPDNRFEGKVVNRVFLGDIIDYIISTGTAELRVRARPECDFAIGDSVHVILPPAKCIGFSEEESHRAAPPLPRSMVDFAVPSA